MSMLKPVGEMVLVMPDETRDVTAGGILLPDAAKKVPETGVVLGVGDKVELPIAAGDRVLYDIYAGVDVESDGAKCLIMPVKEVYAVIT